MGISAELLEEALLHATLKRGAGIPQAERHGQVAEGSKRRDEGGFQSVSRVQAGDILNMHLRSSTARIRLWSLSPDQFLAKQMGLWGKLF